MSDHENPCVLTGPMAWHGADMREQTQWRFVVTENVLAEIDAALTSLARRDTTWQEVGLDSFQLPHLTALFSRITEELENGCGMARLEGLPVASYDETGLRRLLFGLAAHVGTPLYQTARGELIGVIADEGPEVGRRRGQLGDDQSGDVFLSSRSRAQSTAALRWHTDRCDVVGLLCIRPAQSGGISRLASAVSVSNLMLQRHRADAQLLYDNIPRSRLGEERGGENCFYPLPVFAQCDGKFTSHYSRTFVEAAQKNPDVARLTKAQWRALDRLSDIADEVGFEMELRPGDLQFLNNHVIYHGRTPFTDASDPAHKRRLLRVWLSGHRSRRLPAGFEVLWGQTGAGMLRGGMCQSPLAGSGLQASYPEPSERVPPWFLTQ